VAVFVVRGGKKEGRAGEVRVRRKKREENICCPSPSRRCGRSFSFTRNDGDLGWAFFLQPLLGASPGQERAPPPPERRDPIGDDRQQRKDSQLRRCDTSNLRGPLLFPAAASALLPCCLRSIPDGWTPFRPVQTADSSLLYL
jgi:hypothetical protein